MLRNFKEYLSNSKQLVIVDVQPAYKENIPFMDNWAEFLDSYQDILVLYNGPTIGYENKASIAKWYRQHKVPKEKLLNMKWHEKNYAFFRDMMDDGCWQRQEIIRVIRYLLRKKINDWRNLTEQDLEIINKRMEEKLTQQTLRNYLMGIPDLAFMIRKWNGADICGGGFNECLDEVMLLIEAMRLKFNIIREFVYW